MYALVFLTYNSIAYPATNMTARLAHPASGLEAPLVVCVAVPLDVVADAPLSVDPEELDEEPEPELLLLLLLLDEFDDDVVAVVVPLNRAALALKAARVFGDELLLRWSVDCLLGGKSTREYLHVNCHNHAFLTMAGLTTVEPDRLRIVDHHGEDWDICCIGCDWHEARLHHASGIRC